MTRGERLRVVHVAGGLAVSGEVDAHAAPQLSSEIEASSSGLVSAGGSGVRLDLSGVSFLDSSGLRALVVAKQRLEASGGELTLVRPSRTVRRLFEISGLDGWFDVED